MSKIIIELDENEENTDLDLYIHRYDILGAIRELDGFRRDIYKGWHNLDRVLVRNKSVVVTAEDTQKDDYDIQGVHEYIDSSEIIDKLDNILSNVYKFINM